MSAGSEDWLGLLGHVREGDRVAPGDELAEIVTDKAAFELEGAY